MKRLIPALVVFISLWASVPAWAGEWSERNAEALALLRAGRYESGKEEARLALKFIEKTANHDPLDVATSLNTLARLYDANREYAQAQPLYVRSLVIRVNVLGAHHPEVAKSLNNIGAVFSSKLQHEQAESFFSRALTIMENAYGPNHPDVAKCMANLASSYMNQQKFDLAEPLLVQSLQTLTKSLGPYDPAVASVLTRIATLYRKTGRNEAAEEIGARVESFMEFAYETKVSIDL